jgi:excisionase family DNA binding protein
MKKHTNLIKDYLSIKETAEKLGISRSAVYLAIKVGRLATVQLGSHFFVHRRDVQNYKPMEQAVEWGRMPKRAK